MNVTHEHTHRQNAERPTSYKKGPDVMSKSARTRRRHQKAFKGQGKLTGYGFKAPQYDPKVKPKQRSLPTMTKNTTTTKEREMDEDDRGAQPPIAELSSYGARKRSMSVLSDPSTDGEIQSRSDRIRESGGLDEIEENEEQSDMDDAGSGEKVAILEPKVEDHDEELEDWEEELEEHTKGSKNHVRDWEDLRADIKKQLKKESKTLPVSRLNQLMVISCFATLRLKGYSRTQSSIQVARQWHEGEGNWFARHVRALARHYQIFEKLPIERRGGAGNTRSWLHDDLVKKSTLNWLTSQKTGEVTPRKLTHALNETLFPELNITPKSPIGERTARRWLIKLGWRRTVVRKGVYMDGHERDDVVDYRNNSFLPALKEFEKRMSKFEGLEMKRIDPELEEDQRRIIALYHDECCFHANDDARSLW